MILGWILNQENWKKLLGKLAKCYIGLWIREETLKAKEKRKDMPI